MKLEQLNTFLAAAEALNFTAAARRLEVSQSAISQQIRELEMDLGVTLFERRGRGLELTLAGDRLRQRAQVVIHEVRLARSALQDLAGQAHGTLRIGANSTPGIYLLPALLGQYAEAFPAVKASLRIAPLDEVGRSLRDGCLDVAIVTEGAAPPCLTGWSRLHLGDDVLGLVASPDHALGRVGRTTPDVIGRHPVILRPAGSSTRHRVLSTLAACGIDEASLHITFELSHTEGIKRAVMSNLGVAWVSRLASAREHAAGWLRHVDVDGLHVTRPIWALVPPEERRPPHLEAFLASIRGAALAQSGGQP
ncbi:MAG: LysR substrate-binding domain-containing protein [Candidatus Sericytochromatia bacterium]|nr:LysR substrate-binding domain-containing protein [Candidatus Sericytochromatia bacterium]